MVHISISYTGDLHCVAVHGPSQSEVATDAPVDNNGKGEAFSPTDLVATALGTCMATVMSIAAQRHQIDLNGMTVEITKEMSKDTPRRIVRLGGEGGVGRPAPGHVERAGEARRLQLRDLLLRRGPVRRGDDPRDLLERDLVRPRPAGQTRDSGGVLGQRWAGRGLGLSVGAAPTRTAFWTKAYILSAPYAAQ